MELRFKRKMSFNPGNGTTYLCVPREIVQAFEAEYVNVIFDGKSCVRLEPIAS